MKNDDKPSTHISPGAPHKVTNAENSCGIFHERHVVRNSSTDSIATTLTPAKGSDSTDAG
ncbi:unnamed protein product, partial [Ranitomeya imitator]